MRLKTRRQLIAPLTAIWLVVVPLGLVLADVRGAWLYPALICWGAGIATGLKLATRRPLEISSRPIETG